MEISLIRHGKSTCTKTNRISCKEFGNWVKKYDDSTVFEEDSYPTVTLEKITTANIVIASGLKRSVDSVNLLNPNLKSISDPLFRETELPIPITNLWGLKLNSSIWAVISRCLWFSGYSRGCESLSNAKDRAKKASGLLVKYAQEYTSVVLVGHGFFNILIAKELQKTEWKGKKKTSTRHWSCTTYSISKEWWTL